ncbi:MAG: CPBP family intramembrane metalloprotease [Clostridia bacterium]|nr:CPBP family intramembrane metalloprotease [Clostridia bacterium]
MDQVRPAAPSGGGKERGGGKLPFRITAVTLALATYCLLLLSRLIDASLLTRDNEYFGVVILQIMIFLIPAFAYIRWKGDALRSRLRLRPVRADHILLILGALLALMGGSMLLQIAVGAADPAASRFSLYDTFVSKNDGTAGNAAYLILAYAALPAFCEELIFRGIFCAEYDRHGASCAALMSMLFFTMLHFNLRNAPVYLFSALVLCAVMYATESVFAAMAVHFGYNLFGLFGVPYVTAVYTSMGRVWVLIFVLITMLLFGAAIFCGEAARLYRGYATHGVPLGDGGGVNPAITRKESAVRFLRRLLTPQSLICLALYLTVLIVRAVR